MSEIYEILSGCINNKTLKKAVFSKPIDKDVIRATAKIVKLSKGYFVCVEKQTKDGKAVHRNIPLVESTAELEQMICEEYRSLNIIDIGGMAEVLRSKSNNFRVINKIRQSNETNEISENNRKKNYIFPEGQIFDFLVLLGISAPDGRVHDKKQSKFRQINRFVEIISDVSDNLGDNIVVWDLCCGKSYLTYAAYYYLTFIEKKNVKMYGVDLKKDVVEYCNDTAQKLGWNGLKFVCSDINEWQGEKADLVISLHACDVATDIVLAKAVKCGTKVILSSPCCQHELYSMLNSAELSFITKYPMLKKKLCECVTDALRCELLEAFGYSTTTLEFIDPEETPKNIMIRAEFNGISDVNKQRRIEKYSEICSKLNVEPRMKKILINKNIERKNKNEV